MKDFAEKAWAPALAVLTVLALGLALIALAAVFSEPAAAGFWPKVCACFGGSL